MYALIFFSSQLCELALRTSSCNMPKEAVHIAARKQALATWVQVKRLLQQQIGSNVDMLKDEVNPLNHDQIIVFTP